MIALDCGVDVEAGAIYLVIDYLHTLHSDLLFSMCSRTSYTLYWKYLHIINAVVLPQLGSLHADIW